MNIIEKLTKHYQTQPPKLAFGGSEGTAFQTQVFEEWPDHGETIIQATSE